MKGRQIVAAACEKGRRLKHKGEGIMQTRRPLIDGLKPAADPTLEKEFVYNGKPKTAHQSRAALGR
jgi:hypothetical protein